MQKNKKKLEKETTRRSGHAWAVYRPKTNPKQDTKIVMKTPSRMKAKLTDLELFGDEQAAKDFINKSFRDDRILKTQDQVKARRGLQQADLLRSKKGKELINKFIDKAIQHKVLNSGTEIKEDYDVIPVVGPRGGDRTDIHQQPMAIAAGSCLSSQTPQRKMYAEPEGRTTTKKEGKIRPKDIIVPEKNPGVGPYGGGSMSHVSGQPLSGGFGLEPRDAGQKVGTMNNNMNRDQSNRLVKDKEKTEEDIFSEFCESVVADEIDEIIRKVGPEKFRLYSKSGKNLGTAKTHTGAEKREKQVNYFKNVKKEGEELDEARRGTKINPVQANVERYVDMILSRGFSDPEDDQNEQIPRPEGIRSVKKVGFGVRDGAGGNFRDTTRSKGMFANGAVEPRMKKEGTKKINKIKK